MDKPGNNEWKHPRDQTIKELLAGYDPNWKPSTELESVFHTHGRFCADQIHRHKKLEVDLPEGKVSGELVLRTLRQAVHEGGLPPREAQKILLALLGRDDPKKAAQEVK